MATKTFLPIKQTDRARPSFIWRLGLQHFFLFQLSSKSKPVLPNRRFSIKRPLQPAIVLVNNMHHLSGKYNYEFTRCTKVSNSIEELTNFDKISLEETNQELLLPTDNKRCRKSLDKGRKFHTGELAMIIKEDIKNHTSLKVVFKLNNEAIFTCKYGAIQHSDIIGEESGKEFLTSRGLHVLIRRPTLDDYILRMPRLPVISFPKDICMMLMMIDSSPGDVILETGTGSGAVTLFLSKAVGNTGIIHTMDVKEKHQKLAIKNFNRWRDSWNLSHECKWTNNVQFYNGCLINDGLRVLQNITFDGAVIDMEGCHLALPVIAKLLKNGGAICFYVVNITQVIEIYEMIRNQELPFTVEDVIEVGLRYWYVNPARRRNGNIIYSKFNTTNVAVGDGGYDERLEKSTRVPKYIAKPSKESTEHSAFLVKVVKLESYPSSYKV